jgi:hypothetical protein
MSDSDLRHTIHFPIARLGSRLTGTDAVLPTISGTRDYLAFSVTSDRPDERQAYAYAVMVGWGALVFVGGVSILLFGYAADSVGGESARHVAVGLCLAGSMFCAVGMFNAMWRAYWFTWKAKRRDDVGDERFGRAMRGILPRNSSLIGQSIVAVLTLVVLFA